MLAIVQKSLWPKAVVHSPRRRCGSIHVGNPKASRPVSLRALHGVRLQTQNSAAYEKLSPKVFGEEPNAVF